METHIVLLQIATILLAARLFAELASRLKAPPIIGELCAGILLGPSLLNWIQPNDILKLLAEIGIILLLFEVGLDTQLDRLTRAGRKAAVIALVGFVLPFVAGFYISYALFDLPVLVSLFVGGTLTATSIGITVRILTDLKRAQSHEGQIILGAAVIDDIMGVFLLAVLYEFATSGTVTLANTGKIIFYVGSFFLLAPIAAKLISPIIKHVHTNSELPGIIPVLLVALVLVFASLAHVSGAPHLLGGFVAGVALSRRFFLPFSASLNIDPDFTQEIHQKMKPIIQLFTPIFFVMVGLSLDLQAVDWSSRFIWIFSLSVTFIAIVTKLVGPWLVKEDAKTRTAIGIAMVPRGEVGLVFAEIGRTAGIFNPEVYAGLIIVIAFTTLASPLWIKGFYQKYKERLPP